MAHHLRYTLFTSLLLLSACTPESDMQGIDPREYYGAHPIVNKVVAKTESHALVFETGAAKPSKSEVSRLRESIFDRSLLSLQSVEIHMTVADMRSGSRKASLVKMLKYMGYRGDDVHFVSSNLVTMNQVLMNMTFATVVPPNCPDWRMSPSHNFSNHSSANFGCAAEVNLGQMVADPRDLVRGTGELPPALSEHGDMAMKQYRTGGSGASASSAASGGTGAPAAVSAAPSTPSSAPQ